MKHQILTLALALIAPALASGQAVIVKKKSVAEAPAVGSCCEATAPSTTTRVVTVVAPDGDEKKGAKRERKVLRLDAPSGPESAMVLELEGEGEGGHGVTVAPHARHEVIVLDGEDGKKKDKKKTQEIRRTVRRGGEGADEDIIFEVEGHAPSGTFEIEIEEHGDGHGEHRDGHGEHARHRVAGRVIELDGIEDHIRGAIGHALEQVKIKVNGKTLDPKDLASFDWSSLTDMEDIDVQVFGGLPEGDLPFGMATDGSFGFGLARSGQDDDECTCECTCGTKGKGKAKKLPRMARGIFLDRAQDSDDSVLHWVGRKDGPGASIRLKKGEAPNLFSFKREPREQREHQEFMVAPKGGGRGFFFGPSKSEDGKSQYRVWVGTKDEGARAEKKPAPEPTRRRVIRSGPSQGKPEAEQPQPGGALRELRDRVRALKHELDALRRDMGRLRSKI